MTKGKAQINENEEDDEHLTTCGIGSWRPKWLQVFATPLFFMLNLGLVGVIQGMTFSIYISSISSFEKRYAFDSKISGIIMIADNFADMILNPIMGYFSVRYNRARMIGIGELVLSLGCFLAASPYFIYGPAKHLLNDQTLLSMVSKNGTNFDMCSADGVTNAGECSANQGATVWPAVIILITASWFRGMGYTCYMVMGLPYLDDNIKKNQSPLYISVMQSIRLIGPAMGFVLSSFCLSYYEDPFFDPGFGRNDPRFVGAWWLSFVVVGVLLFIVAVPMLLFPTELRNARVKQVDIKEKMKNSGGGWGAFRRFFTNPVVQLYTWGNIFRYIGLGGYVMFKSKYIETQYKQSSSSASILTGFSSFMPMGIGIMLGGTMLSIFKPRPRIIFLLVFLVEGISIFTVGSALFLGCNPLKIDGAYDLDKSYFSLQTSCNSQCNCGTRVYTPVCGSDGMTNYFSPCYAGCSSYNALNSTFENCACFGGHATKGYCQNDVSSCNNLVKYISVITFGNFMSSFARTPNSLIALRSVEPMDKSFAFGLASSLMDIFAFVPNPLIFGYLTDLSCLIWESKCGKTGNCWLYDNDKFRKYLHLGAMFFFCIGSLFDFILIFFADRVKNFYDESDDDGGDAERPKPIESTKDAKSGEITNGPQIELQGISGSADMSNNANKP